MEQQIGTNKKTKQILTREQVRPSKSLGQNFLVDQNILRKIADTAGLTGEELVIEIGPGLGALTQLLIQRAAQVIGVELDQRLIPILERQFKERTNFQLVQGDALKLDFRQLVGQFPQLKKVKLVANLPYYISTPLIVKLLTEGVNWDGIVIMVQKEVAERLAAAPGGKDYGQLSVLVQYYAQTELAFTVPPTVFNPRPKIDSAVVRILPWDVPPVKVIDEKLFFQVVKSAFSQRRKNLRNNLASLEQFKGNKAAVEQLLCGLDIDFSRRGETLSLEEFARIANALT